MPRMDVYTTRPSGPHGTTVSWKESEALVGWALRLVLLNLIGWGVAGLVTLAAVVLTILGAL